MLTMCPECELQVSDKAIVCPHCGYPLKPDKRQYAKRSNRRKRLPNGFGQISELKGRNLRSPFRVMITVGKDEKGRPICRLLKPTAYFATYNEAYAALMEYNKHPYDLSSFLTMQELYDKWMADRGCKKSKSAIDNYKCSWTYCSAIYNTPVRDIRIRHIKGCIFDSVVIRNGEEVKPTPHMQVRIKTVLNLLMDYAVEFELAEKNYAKTFRIRDIVDKEEIATKTPHITFTEDEQKLLWDNINNYDEIDMIIVQCYMGWRPQELCELLLENVDLENNTIKGGMKTRSGKDRIVPIHPCIKSIIVNRYKQAEERGNPYLFTHEHYVHGKMTKYIKYSYTRYARGFASLVTKLGLNPEHLPHDGRVCFVTNAKKAEVDDFALKYFVGHKIDDITEAVYTKREPAWYQEEIKKIKGPACSA